MGTEEDILALIVELLSTIKDLRPRTRGGEISLLTRFKEDLGFDSLALMTLAFELQEHYPELDESSIARWVTVGDCVRSLSRSDGE